MRKDASSAPKGAPRNYQESGGLYSNINASPLVIG